MRNAHYKYFKVIWKCSYLHDVKNMIHTIYNNILLYFIYVNYFGLLYLFDHTDFLTNHGRIRHLFYYHDFVPVSMYILNSVSFI